MYRLGALQNRRGALCTCKCKVTYPFRDTACDGEKHSESRMLLLGATAFRSILASATEIYVVTSQLSVVVGDVSPHADLLMDDLIQSGPFITL